MRKYFVCCMFVATLGLPAQSLYTRQPLLERVTSSAADMDDDLVLKRTLYGPLRADETTPEQAALMVEAAKRRVDRVQERIDQAKEMIDQGILARNEIQPLTEELTYRRSALSLAESRARFLKGLSEMARAEQAFDTQDDDTGYRPIQERFDGNGQMSAGVFRKVLLSFEKQFARPLPISANGETAVHKSMGFDHRGRVDVALAPDTAEGAWLREYLQREQIPYYAFRGAVLGRATAAHIHIGPASTRLRVAD
ncbi:MAG: hypothetical protein HY858_15590 [Candidatus Solibacter usitatus]|nr:hypothetical protein [Candidatus Solibacter usitatus]